MHTSPQCFGIIPARYDSSRFPGKPLVDILGKPMFVRVYERARACPLFEQVALATDDQRIMDAAKAWGVPALMTSPAHESGTDRVLEAARLLGAGPDAVVVNIQGDEPLLEPAMLAELLAPFSGPQGALVQATTLASPLERAEAASPDRVKVVLDSEGRALYFSRALIPFDRDGNGKGVGPLLHIGLYGFRMATLERFAALPQGLLEKTEKLEQLRLLENAIPLHVSLTRHCCHGVDRPEDVSHIVKILLEQEK
ncbi:MAG: 3-deoxy-manno-octulosonate cytidylyltransferase [Humidesulfovibrio sp.]|uniref:3-deoxy-manno-octulosonate cytidylyltransferase n=1 Tax=Humidesulfovibrio sp. TaxID=2910988 RepID=UPI0027E6D681|nr:3-deoxy-manno-octulosonate cytidylyltransferase [Humidesulfovibrio sp.]MDQ7835805.1 3-deoxy-manno-octulosonate cytidylyltransferase [Humidesulfovibrio sp.]